MGQPHLRRAQDVTGRMQRDPDAVVLDGLAIRQALQRDLAQARAQGAFAMGVCKVMPVTDPCMVRVCVGDDGAWNRFPRVNIKIPSSAIQAFRPGNDQIHAAAGSDADGTGRCW
jgi:hypothetical protein